MHDAIYLDSSALDEQSINLLLYDYERNHGKFPEIIYMNFELYAKLCAKSQDPCIFIHSNFESYYISDLCIIKISIRYNMRQGGAMCS